MRLSMFSYKIKSKDSLNILPGGFKVIIFNTLTR